jgi:hypothetical protein
VKGREKGEWVCGKLGAGWLKSERTLMPFSLAQKMQCDPQGKTTCAAFSAAARP